MHWRSRRCFAILLVLCAGSVSGRARPDRSTAATLHAFARQTPSNDPLHAYVLDWAARSVTAIDAAGRPVRVGSYGPESIMRRGPFSGNSPVTFNVFAQEDEGTPAEMVLSPAVARLAVLDHGPGKDTERFGWHPSRRSSIAIFGSQTLRPLGAVDGVWGLPTLHRVSRDGRTLTLVGPGYQSNKPAETKPAELVTIDLRSGTLTGRFDLSDIVSPARDWENWIDTIALSPDGDHLYVAGRGSLAADPVRTGSVHVVETATGQRKPPLDVGLDPRGLVVDQAGDNILLLSDRRPSHDGAERSGELTVIRGDRIAVSVPVAADPLFLRVSPDRASIHVFSAQALTTVDVHSMRQAGRTVIKRAGVSWTAPEPAPGTILRDQGRIDDAVIAPDGRQAYVVHYGSSQLSIVDLVNQKVRATITTGRRSQKIRLFLTAAAASAVSQWAAERQARALGHHQYFYTTYFVLPARTAVVTRADGRFVYVVNLQTRDITVIDAAAARIVKHLPARGTYLQVMPNSDLIAVAGAEEVSFIDLRSHAFLERRRLKGDHYGVTASPNGQEVFLLSSGEVTTLNPRSGESIATSNAFLVPTQVIFTEPGPAVTDEGMDDALPNPFDLETENGVLPASRWQVLHFHRRTKCQGWLYVTDARIGYRTTFEDGHSWEVAFSEVKEIKANKAVGGGGMLGSFHVRLREGANYNLSLNGISAERMVALLNKTVAATK